MNPAPASASAANSDLFCISCGYNQRGITADRCPECGHLHALSAPSATRLPWLHRRHLGAFRAYWRTCRLVLLHPKEFCTHIDTPITLADARRFWLTSILLAWGSLVLAALTLWIFPPNNYSSSALGDLYDGLFLWVTIPIPMLIFLLIGALLFFTATTGFAGYFCHPRTLSVPQQNRAVALSYFASAALIFVPTIIAPLLAARILYRFPPLDTAAKMLSAAAAVLFVCVWHISTIRIILRLSQRRRRKLTAVLITLCWLLLWAVCLVLIPFTLWYIAMAIYSLF